MHTLILCSTEAFQKLWGGMATAKKALITNNRKWICTVWLFTRDLTLFPSHELIFFILFSIRQTPYKLKWDEYGLVLPSQKYKKLLFAVALSFTQIENVRHCSFYIRIVFTFYAVFYQRCDFFCYFMHEKWKFLFLFYLYLLQNTSSYTFLITIHLFIFNGQFDAIFIFGCTCEREKIYLHCICIVQDNYNYHDCGK